MLTHFRNAVPLVWGSLRLAPIILLYHFVTHFLRPFLLFLETKYPALLYNQWVQA